MSAAGGGARRGWRTATVLVAAGVVVPILLVASSVLTPDVDVWRFLWETTLPEAIVSTVVLLAGVVAGTVVLGGGLAWLTAIYRFPGRRAFSWLLVLPLAVPAYVLGFVAVSLLDAPGPVQTALRAVAGPDVWFPAPRGTWLAITVLTLALYPYVYLLARAAVVEQSAATYQAARTLGLGPLRAAAKVVLPLARPSLAAGGALVAMETLTDFATVQYFNVETISVSMYRVWNGMYDRAAATELASAVLVFAVAVIVVERLLRGRARYHQQGGAARSVEPVALHGVKAWAATGLCGAVVAVAVAVPVAQLLGWSSLVTLRGAAGGFDPRYLGYLGNSALVAGLAAIVCVLVGAVVVNAGRFAGDGVTRGLGRLTTVGYAVPGPVVAIGVLLLLAGVDRGLDAVGVGWGTRLVTGSLVGLVYAYGVRFLALATNSLEASLDKVGPSVTMSALTLGATPRAVVRRVHLPLIRSGLGVALVLVAVDALKELPVVLLLRPFGFETLAVWVYQLASESRWELAGLPALTIVAVAAIPVVLLFRGTLAGAAPASVPTPVDERTPPEAVVVR